MSVKTSIPSVQENQTPVEYRVYRRRWFILFIFVTLYFIGSSQWIQYTIIGNIVMKYYGISASMTNMTSVIFFVLYLPLIIPASYITKKKGVRYVMVLAVCGHFIGAWIKVFSAHPNRFYIGFIGQTIVAVSQIFVSSMPPKLAGIWFAQNQISKACTIGYYGNIFGLSAGYLLSPIIVQDHGNMDDIGHNLFVLFLITAITTTVVLFLVVAYFEEEPPIFPSEAQQKQKQETSNTFESYKKLLTNGSFVMLFCAYALNVGVNNSISTLFNPILLEHFKTNGEQFAGSVGIVFCTSSCFSTILFGIILDRTKKFNFFMNGYVPVAYETGVELTYPESEFNSTGVLSSGSHIMGGVFTILFTYILEKTNGFWTNLSMTMLLVMGTIFTILTRNVRKRQDALQRV